MELGGGATSLMTVVAVDQVLVKAVEAVEITVNLFVDVNGMS